VDAQTSVAGAQKSVAAQKAEAGGQKSASGAQNSVVGAQKSVAGDQKSLFKSLSHYNLPLDVVRQANAAHWKLLTVFTAIDSKALHRELDLTAGTVGI
jgi:hypothetical protein